MNTRFGLLVLSFLDRFERALNSARETLKRARQRFHSTAIATEQKELFGYGDKSSKGKKKVCPSPWTKQFYCLAYCNQDHVPVTEDELYHAGLGLKKIIVPDMNTLNNHHFRSIIIENLPSLREAGGFYFLRCILFYTLFCHLEEVGLWIVPPICLHSITFVINQSLCCFVEGWCHHKIRSENNRTPLQLWISGSIARMESGSQEDCCLSEVCYALQM